MTLSGTATPMPPISSRSSPAAASMVASASPRSILASLVPTLPRMSWMFRSGRRLKSCAARLGLAVPTRAPRGSASIDDAPINRSRASARGRMAAISRSTGRMVSTSFIEWTAASIRPPFSAASSSRVHNALPPISASARSCTLSPLATSGTSSTDPSPQPCAAISAAAAILACASASGERRVPRRKGRSGVKTLVICALC